MKKLVIFILVLSMALMSLVACGGGEGSDDTTVPSTNAPGATDAPGDETTKTPDTTKAVTTKPVTTAPPVVTEPPIEVPVAPIGAMVYFENFDGYPNTADNDATMSALGWKILNTADGALKDNTGTYTIEDGTLKFVNNITGAADSYVHMIDGDYMISAHQGDYTLQYDLKYTSSGNSERYAVILLNFDGRDSYNSFHLRMAGSANNQTRYVGGWQTYDVAGDFYAADKSDADGTSTVAKKLFGTDYDATVMACQDKWITIRYQASYENGPTVWLRDNSAANPTFVCVSKADPSAAGFLYWGLIEAYGVALKLGTTIDGYLDNIAIWTGLGEMPTNTSTADYEAAIASYLDEVAKRG